MNGKATQRSERILRELQQSRAVCSMRSAGSRWRAAKLKMSRIFADKAFLERRIEVLGV